MVQVLRAIFPGLEPVVQALICQAGDPFAQRGLALLLQRLGHSGALIFAPHELVSCRALQLLHVIHLVHQDSLLLFHHHNGLALFEVLPAPERTVFVVLVDPVDDRLEESLGHHKLP